MDRIGPVHEHVYVIPIDYQADEAPTFVSLSLSQVVYHARPPIVTAVIVRSTSGASGPAGSRRES